MPTPPTGLTADEARSSALDTAPKSRTDTDREVLENTADAIRIANELNSKAGSPIEKNNLRIEPIVDGNGRFTGEVRVIR